MIDWPFDPRIGFALAIWALGLSRAVLFLPLGHGLLALRGAKGRIAFPSLCAVFARRWAFLLGPLALWWPTLRLDVFTHQDTSDAAWDLTGLERRFRQVRLLVMAEALLILGLLPLGLLLHAPDSALIVILLTAYLLYSLIALRLLWRGRGAQSLTSQWRHILEPLLCIPYAPFVLAQINHSRKLALPLEQALARFPAQTEATRAALSAYLAGVAEMMDDPAAHRQIAALQTQLAAPR